MPLYKKISVFFILFSCFADLGFSQPRDPYSPFEIGFSIGIQSITKEKMEYAKSVGLSSVQISLNPLVNKEGDLRYTEEEIGLLVQEVKEILEYTDIKAGSFHMPFGEHVDLSLINEEKRKKVVDLHKRLLILCAPLQPKVVLFHPSWYLSLDEREKHGDQLIQSIMELRKSTQKMGSVLVIENMTGPELHVESKGQKYERPLFRTVEETLTLLDKMPSDIYAAVDLNHMLNPEKLILALGDRLKFIHVADGDGENELHYYPCSGKGMNNWVNIFDALYKVGYTGPFMYESHYDDLNDLAVCFKFMYNQFLLEKEIKHKYESN